MGLHQPNGITTINTVFLLHFSQHCWKVQESRERWEISAKPKDPRWLAIDALQEQQSNWPPKGCLWRVRFVLRLSTLNYHHSKALVRGVSH